MSLLMTEQQVLMWIVEHLLQLVPFVLALLGHVGRAAFALQT